MQDFVPFIPSFHAEISTIHYYNISILCTFCNTPLSREKGPMGGIPYIRLKKREVGQHCRHQYCDYKTHEAV